VGVHYCYDIQNRRAREHVATVDGENTTTHQTAFFYDGNQVFGQFEKGSTGILAATDLAHRDLWGPAVDQLPAQESPLLPGQNQTTMQAGGTVGRRLYQ
jgi:hypothetical protein